MQKTEVRLTDLFPVRYEAFDTSGVVFVFRPAADGTFWHCRRDGRRSKIADYVVPRMVELAVMHTDKAYFEIGTDRNGYVVRISQGSRGRTIHAAGFSEALHAACAAVGMPTPELPAGWDGKAWFESAPLAA